MSNMQAPYTVYIVILKAEWLGGKPFLLSLAKKKIQLYGLLN
jgi:hypothetical protein